MAQETWVQSKVESYQRLKKWYLMPPWLTLSIIGYGFWVKGVNPGKGAALSPTPRCCSYWEPLGHFRLQSPTLLTYNNLVHASLLSGSYMTEANMPRYLPSVVGNIVVIDALTNSALFRSVWDLKLRRLTYIVILFGNLYIINSK